MRSTPGGDGVPGTGPAASRTGPAQPPPTPPRALAYSDVPPEESTVAIDNASRSGRPAATRATGSSNYRNAAAAPSAGRTASRPAARRPGPTRTGSTLNRSEPGPLSVSAVVGFVLSGLGFLLVTAPIGLWFGYRGLHETETDTRQGRPFATWAVYLGWAWITFWVLALITYLWILL